MTKIRELLKRNIGRTINPAVTVENTEKDTIVSEIEEYVFTQKLLDEQYKLINTILNKREGKTGIWINGYYGSGKSHFIKFANFCFSSRHTVAAFDHFIEAAKDHPDEFAEAQAPAVSRLKNRIAAHPSETIIFNVEAVSGDREHKDRLTRIFLNQLNRHRGYNPVNIPLALYLEKYLDKAGKFDAFKQKFLERFKDHWEHITNDVVNLKLDKIIALAQELDPDIDGKALHSKILNPDDITIRDTLVPELADYVNNKPDDFRLIFMVDEISQYIGTNMELLLNLQTIVEAIEEPCNRKVWVVVTAQQKLEEVVDKVKENNVVQDEDAVGKILGRFETRIALESQEADYITKKRVLDKKPEKVQPLKDYYNAHKEEILNHFALPRQTLYKSFQDEDDFILSYPFIPYQLKLIADVFDSFYQKAYVIKEVKDNERSVLGITHFTTKQHADRELGYFIPFDAFFNNTFDTNLTHVGRKIAEPALQYTKNNDFARRVVKVLFMVSNITQLRLNQFVPNVDNLTLLLYTGFHEDRREIAENVRVVLKDLVNNNLIYEENGNYFFYKEDEMEVAAEIQHVKPTMAQRNERFYSLLKNMLKLEGKTRFEDNEFQVKFALDGRDIINSGDIRVEFLIFKAPGIDQAAFGNAQQDLRIAMNEWLMANQELQQQFTNWLKTSIYIETYFDTSSSQRQKTHEKFRDRNQRLHEELLKTMSDKFAQTPFISGNTVIKPDQIAAKTPDKRYRKALEMHLKNVYKQHELAADFALQDHKALRAKATESQQSYQEDLHPAEKRVLEKMEMFGGEVFLSDLCSEFSQPPFGWKDLTVIHIVLALIRKNHCKVSHRNNDFTPPKDFVEQAMKIRERKAMLVKPGDKISLEEIQQVQQAVKTIFNQAQVLPSDSRELFNKLRNEVLPAQQEEWQKVASKDDYAGFPFARIFRKFAGLLNEILKERDVPLFFQAIISQQEELVRAHDRARELRDFMQDNFKRYNEIHEFLKNNASNFKHLQPEEQDQAHQMERFFREETFPVEGFRDILKMHNRISEALDKARQQLKQDVKSNYEQIVQELENEAQKHGLTANAVAEPQQTLERIDQQDTIIDLKYLQKDAGDRRTEWLQTIIDEAARKKAKEQQQQAQQKSETLTESEGNKETGGEKPPETSPEPSLKPSVIVSLSGFNDGRSTLSTEQEVEDYVEELRQTLHQKLKEAKTIILK